MWSRRQFDDALPTLVRYAGLILTVGLTIALVLGVDYTQVAPGFVPAAGMLLYKTVREAANGNGGEERWTHLP